MIIGLIKNEVEYKQALNRIELLLDEAENQETDRELELLGHLVDKHESEQFPIEYPDSIEAIKVRMGDLGLKQKDLVKIMGSHSKVSEVLNRKRRLSLPMIRALHRHLHIPAEVLLQEDGKDLPDDDSRIDWQSFPVSTIVSRGWVNHITSNLKEHAEEVVLSLRDLACGQWAPNGLSVMLRQGSFKKRQTDSYALQTWLMMIMAKAKHFDQYCNQALGPYRPETLTPDVLSELIDLSVDGETAPLPAMNYLARFGIKLVFEKHFHKTYLDGACFLGNDGNPVIGLTLRHDRIDAFWFTLLHEIAHLQLHISPEQQLILDEDIQNSVDQQEKEASDFAAKTLIPDHIWYEHPARETAKKQHVQDLAQKLVLHPAIIAGRIRYERNNYKILHNVVGSGEIRPFCEQHGLLKPVINRA